MELYAPNYNLPRAFICDIDGTISNHNGSRGHFEYSKVSADKPEWHIIHLVETLTASHSPVWQVIFVSGREDSCRKDTIDWIAEYLPLTHSLGYELYMRETGDYRKDFEIKAEIFDNHIRNRFWVEFALDDRDQVVNMWREAGLPCLQVAEGNF